MSIDVNEEPTQNQVLLNQVTSIIEEFIGNEAIAESFINQTDNQLPCFVIHNQKWSEVAQLLKNHPDLQFDYLRNLSGVDQETHMEVVYHITSMKKNTDLCIKVNTSRENPSIESVTFVWSTANWTEREVYDLLGIHFNNHPDLRRIMMPDDWVGYPLRKDYVPIDPEV